MAIGHGIKSIKQRLLIYFVFIVIITVGILELFLINVVKQNYYKNLEIGLYNQIKVSSDLYMRYFSGTSLHEIVINNVDVLWKQSTAQVEIIDNTGKILMDSIGNIPPNAAEIEDVKQALEGKTGKWIGKMPGGNEKVMALSYPLKLEDKSLGILRFITSLREVDREINKITLVFILIGIGVVLGAIAISFYLSHTIVGPLKDVTAVAEKMAKGNYKIQSRKSYDDEIGKLSDTLNHMAQEILKKDQLKNEFISSVSHELRTPLTSIKGWTVTLRNGSLNDEKLLMDGLEIIEKESDRLTSMVEELLDFSKFVSGKITVKKEPVDVKRLVQQINKQLLPRAQRENIQLIIECQDSMPDIISDENRLKQLFINILDNSFNFTPTGGKILFAVLFNNDRFIFTIEDTGCGIAPEELPKVKEKFYKGKSSKSQNGIGLSICDEIVNLMGGTFDIQSEVDKGTRVSIALPLLKEGDI